MNDIIKLNDLLKLTDTSKIKVKFNMKNPAGIDPIEEFQKNPDIINFQWNLWKDTRQVLKVDEILIGLVRAGVDLWLLTTVEKITKEFPNVSNQVGYEATELNEFRPFFGRTLINFHNNTRIPIRIYDHISQPLIVTQILPSIYTNDGFPGYDQVRLSYQKLERILSQKRTDWYAALKSQHGVYLITDLKTSKLYVGSATSQNGGIWSRWQDYVVTGHGDNVALKKLVNEKGIEYVQKNFQYSILENYNTRVDDQIILARETWWKKTLQSRDKESGYNRN